MSDVQITSASDAREKAEQEYIAAHAKPVEPERPPIVRPQLVSLGRGARVWLEVDFGYRSEPVIRFCAKDFQGQADEVKQDELIALRAEIDRALGDFAAVATYAEAKDAHDRAMRKYTDEMHDARERAATAWYKARDEDDEPSESDYDDEDQEDDEKF